MLKLSVSVELAPAIRKTEQSRELLSDFTWLYNQVSHPWWLDQAEANFATHGRHSNQDWSLEVERKYLAFKRAVSDRDDPLRWGSGREQIYPSVTDPAHPMHVWRVEPDGYTIGSVAPNFENVRRPGVGPFDEPYPARDPFGATQAQLDDLAAKKQLALDAALAEIWES